MTGSKTVFVGAMWAAVTLALLLPVGVHAQNAYITNSGSNTVSVIGTAPNATCMIAGATPPCVTATIMVGARPFGVAVTPDGTKAYVTNNQSNSVSVIDTATNTVIVPPSPLAVGRTPIGIAVTPDGTKAYVANASDDTVSVIDTATDTVSSSTIALRTGVAPYGVAVSPDGTKVYVTTRNGGGMAAIDVATHAVTGPNAVVSTETEISGVAVTPDGTKAYVAGGNIVSVVNTATITPEKAIFVPTDFPSGVAITPDGNTVYIPGGNVVSVVNTATNAVTDTITVGNDPSGVALTPDGSKLYVVNGHDNTVSVIGTAPNTTCTIAGATPPCVTATVNVGPSPLAFGVFISPKEICSNNGDPCIQVRVDPVQGCLMDDGTSFNPKFWNDNGTTQHSKNCYAYATNKATQATGTFPQPGYGAGLPLPGKSDFSCVTITARAAKDGLIPLPSDPADSNGCVVNDHSCDFSCPDDSRKLALVVAPGVDYHWYREDSDEISPSTGRPTWSHKRGSWPAINFDAPAFDASGKFIPGKIITDPRTANRDYSHVPPGVQAGANYSCFCTCLCTRLSCDETIKGIK